MELRLSFRLSEGITSADINISGYGSISITAPDHEIRIPVQELHQRFVVRCTSYATAESGLNSGGILKFSGVTGGIDISDECGTSSVIRVYAYGETYEHIVIYNSNYRCQ
mgnify:FL=1